MSNLLMLDRRIGTLCEQLKGLMTKQSFPVESIEYKKGFYLYPEEADDEVEFGPFDPEKDHIYGPDEHYWFRFTYTVPEELDGKVLQFHINDYYREWNVSVPQYLLFIDQQLIQGMDINHTCVVITDKAKAGETHVFDLQVYTGPTTREFQLKMTMEELDVETKDLYYDLYVPYSGFTAMDHETRSYGLLERALNDAVNLLDLRTPYSKEYYESVAKARALLQKTVYGELAGHDDVIASCIGHTHIDVAWQWTYDQTREKVIRSFSTVLNLMKQYPEYRFMSSQPQLYAFVEERYPELYENIKKAIKEKKWEPEGGMWVEADCNLTSGESLVRQFMYGKKFFKDQFGVDNKILWLPDVFGYSGALPQIMKKCGIDYFMTTKVFWNEFNKIPADTLRWIGIDGSEVLAHFITTQNPGQDPSEFITTYNGLIDTDALIRSWNRYQNKDLNNDILISFGWGDGGGGPTTEMLETARRLEKGIVGIPKVRQVFTREYFDTLKKNVQDNPFLPTWEGEFYFEFHRGTLSSIGRNKRSNRKSELGLMDAELLSVMAKDKVEYPTRDLSDMWHTVLLNQFHDVLPGSSIHQVYEDTREMYKEIASELHRIRKEDMAALAPEGAGVTLFNTTGFFRSDVAILKNVDADALVDEEGNAYPIQKLADGKSSAVYVPGLAPKSWTSFDLGSYEQPVLNPIQITTNGVETPFFTVTFAPDMSITSIYDKSADREVVAPGQCVNVMKMYEDKPYKYSNWNTDIYYSQKSFGIGAPAQSEWTEVGPVRATLVNRYKFSNSKMIQKIHFYADIRRIDFETWIDWKDTEHLLKVHFPVDIHSNEATFDVQFGNLTRTTHTNTSWDKACFESCGQKWIDLSEGHYGVSLLNDCKYGHSVDGNNMGLTLIKSGTFPDPHADQEEHIITYSLLPHEGTWREADTNAQGYFINQPILSVDQGVSGQKFSMANVEKSNIVIETIKKAEDSDAIVVRLYESDNSRTRTVLHWNKPIKSVEETDMLEQNGALLKAEDGDIALEFKPYEIKTLVIREK